MPEFNNGYGIQFLGKHSWRDYGLRLLTKEVTMPEKVPVIVKLPYSNSIVDLSALYNHQVFNDRTFTTTFLLTAWESHTKEQLYEKWTEIVNWVMGTPGRQPLIDDIMSDYHYLGEVVTAPSWDEMRLYGKLTVEWTCYPFRIHAALEGDDIWDDFNFDTDVAQETGFDVTDTMKVTLLNTGTQPAQPTIIAGAAFTVAVAGGQTYKLEKGTITAANAAYPFTLPVGTSELTITGSGHIEFQWHKEVI